MENKLKLFSQWNAVSKRDETYFPVNMLSEYVESYLDLFSEVIFNPRLVSEIVNEERQRVLREISLDKSNPTFKDNTLFYNKLFGNTPFNYYVLGNEIVVEKASPTDLLQFHDLGYFASNTDLILVGGLPKNIETLVEKFLEDKPIGNVKKIEFPMLGPLDEKTVIHVPAPELRNQDNIGESLAEIRMAWRVPDSFTDEASSLLTLARILGGDIHSKLMVELSRRKGLTYHIDCRYMGGSRKGAGVIMLNTFVPSRNVHETLDIIFDQFEVTKNQEIDYTELDRIKRDIKFSFAAEKESNSGHVNVIWRKIDFDVTPEIEFDRINKVSPKNILETAAEHLPQKDGNYVLMIRDPLKGYNG